PNPFDTEADSDSDPDLASRSTFSDRLLLGNCLDLPFQQTKAVAAIPPTQQANKPLLPHLRVFVSSKFSFPLP
ncbi:MAG: hypothetical protein PHG55_03725, partial [Verrucomicrobiota bacterium]|nr:hypothetical protein [Verrucomicrobiota bacterium]